jgi:glycine/D-amino acid oxidase-like deaminating enzyme
MKGSSRGGHGYKMGPALGEMLAKQVLDDAPADPLFGLARLAGGRTG